MIHAPQDSLKLGSYFSDLSLYLRTESQCQDINTFGTLLEQSLTELQSVYATVGRSLHRITTANSEESNEKAEAKVHLPTRIESSNLKRCIETHYTHSLTSVAAIKNNERSISSSSPPVNKHTKEITYSEDMSLDQTELKLRSGELSECKREMEQFLGKDFDFNLLKFQKAKTNNDHILIAAGSIALLPFFEKLNPAASLATFHTVVSNFLTAIAERYLPNSYHNSIHGAQVLHFSMYFMRNFTATRINQIQLSTALDSNVKSQHSKPTIDPNVTMEGCLGAPQHCFIESFESIELFALYVASICHDVGHFGRTSSFCTKSNHIISRMYNDRSILENYHCSITFMVMSGEDHPCLGEGFSKPKNCNVMDLLRRNEVNLAVCI